MSVELMNAYYKYLGGYLMELKIYENMLTVAAMQSLRVSCDLPLLEPEMIKTALSRSLLNLTAVVDDRVVGMLRVVGDGLFVFIICDVMVMPEYRNLGIASALVAHSLQCIEYMLPSGFVGVVSLFSVKEHVKLYKRLGFKPLPRGSKGPGMQTIVIGK